MTSFMDKYKTMRKLRSKKFGSSPEDQVEKRQRLTRQTELANDFLTYAKKLNDTFAQLRAIHMDFSAKMEDTGLNVDTWPGLPHSSVFSFKLVLDRVDERLSHVVHVPMEELLRQFEMCQMQVARQDELAWSRERYEKKLEGLRASSPTTQNQSKVVRNEEKLRSVISEHDNTLQNVEELLEDLTTTQREEEARRISIMMDQYLEIFQQFGADVAEPRKHLSEKKQRDAPKGIVGFLTREVNKGKIQREAARIRQSASTISAQKQRNPKPPAANPFDEDIAPARNATNPFDMDLEHNTNDTNSAPNENGVDRVYVAHGVC
eukprot:GEMP01049757.1.p1 GENE.GEMP01049757.1~~GEMP01049757.1.p1  ORF type:complete len:320 (+),score=75.03 GEMP01049757.1:133-1092(+)